MSTLCYDFVLGHGLALPTDSQAGTLTSGFGHIASTRWGHTGQRQASEAGSG